MLRFLVKLKHKCPWLWTILEECNGKLFGLMYSNIEDKAVGLLSSVTMPGYSFSLVEDEDIRIIGEILRRGPKSYMSSFQPHPFDEHTLARLHRNASFLMMKVSSADSNQIVGYFFLRCFFIGIAYHGLYVEMPHGRGGIGTCMWNVSARICNSCGLKMRATIADSNQPSIHSLYKACEVKAVNQVDANYAQYIIGTPKNIDL